MVSGCGNARGDSSGGADQHRDIVVDGRSRGYELHLPAGVTALAGLPVVLAFHGGLGTDTGMVRLTHLNQIADARRFAVVYPAGYQSSWNDGRPNTPANQAGIDEVAFVSALIDQLVNHDHADGSRIYATGISNGGMFTQRLGCALAGELAGIAPVAGPLPVDIAPGCHPARPIPVLEIHGTDDPIVPYDGGHVSGRGSGGDVISVADTMSRWRSVDGCSSTTTTTVPDKVDDGTHVRMTSGVGCQVGSRVVLYTVVGGGHTWPGGWPYLPAVIIGRVSGQFDASQVIWDFFAGQ